ncbi:MAG TPA: hypothetical protein IAA56_04310 [Candidatus Galloscillospira excrementavium]|nr:hypothetical protein [Candidatus Galloscillospira excrementavium]
MNRFLINCAWDIMDLGKANHVDNSVARDMFVENLATFGTGAFPNYPGAEVDYAALSAAWKVLSDSEQADAKISCANFMRDCYDEISETRRAGSPAKFYDIAAHYEAEEQAKPDYLLYTHAWDIWDKAETDGTDLVTAQKAYVETLEGWGNLSREEQAEEADWFALKVAPYDKGLQYARLTDDRALFEAILATR